MIRLTNSQNFVRIPAGLIRRIAGQVLKEERLAGDVGIVFVDNAAIRRINKKFLGRDRVTDVISFPLADWVNPKDRTLAEIVVSAEKARREALRLGVPVRCELALYVVHGLLHLGCFDDDTPENAARMHRRERRFLKKFFPRIDLSSLRLFP
jgi:probable rRNA maturation factor